MAETSTEPVRRVVDGIYRSESRHVLATLIRLLGDFDLAEEALHEAFGVWGGRPTPAHLTEGPSPSPDRSRNAASSNGGFKNFRTEGHAIPDVAQAAIG